MVKATNTWNLKTMNSLYASKMKMKKIMIMMTTMIMTTKVTKVYIPSTTTTVT